MWLYLGVRRRKIHNCNRHLSFRVPFFLLLHFSVFSLNSETIIFNPPTEPKNRLQMLAKAIHNKSLPSFDFFFHPQHTHSIMSQTQTRPQHDILLFFVLLLFSFFYTIRHTPIAKHVHCVCDRSQFTFLMVQIIIFFTLPRKKREKKKLFQSTAWMNKSSSIERMKNVIQNKTMKKLIFSLLCDCPMRSVR